MPNTPAQWQESFIRSERYDVERRLNDEKTLLNESQSAVTVHRERIEQLQAQLDLLNSILPKLQTLVLQSLSDKDARKE
jgi:uncharacterized coiled-coil protein SlyX